MLIFHTNFTLSKFFYTFKFVKLRVKVLPAILTLCSPLFLSFENQLLNGLAIVAQFGFWINYRTFVTLQAIIDFLLLGLEIRLFCGRRMLFWWLFLQVSLFNRLLLCWLLSLYALLTNLNHLLYLHIFSSTLPAHSFDKLVTLYSIYELISAHIKTLLT